MRPCGDSDDKKISNTSLHLVTTRLIILTFIFPSPLRSTPNDIFFEFTLIFCNHGCERSGLVCLETNKQK
jgi:hypothetical protein